MHNRHITVMNASCTLPVFERLRTAGLRPTRQRLALADILFTGEDRHVTAEQLHGEAQNREIPVSLAPVYNTLHQFTEAGLLREVVVEPGRSYFDTNTTEHHHFYEAVDGKLRDIPGCSLNLVCLPSPPEGMSITSVEVIIRVARCQG